MNDLPSSFDNLAPGVGPSDLEPEDTRESGEDIADRREL